MKTAHEVNNSKWTSKVTMFWVKVLIALTLLMTAGLFAMSWYYQ